MVDTPTAVPDGRTLAGRYRLKAPIARGGMAQVWEAEDQVLARPVAVKLLLDALSGDEAVRERFRREAIAAARLAHPNVVATFDTGIDDGEAFIVMELVHGSTLRDLLAERGALPLPLAVAVADQIADALAAAHRAGLVHRDIKPANVLVADLDGTAVRVKVTDFGIAKAAEEAGGADLTLTGTVIGTPKYLSPEQVRGHEPDPRADLYALGVVLYEMVAGRPPFEGSTHMATALSHLTDTAPPLSSIRAGVPAPLDDVVAGLLAKDPGGRYTTAGEVRAALAAIARLVADPSASGHVPLPQQAAPPARPVDDTVVSAPARGATVVVPTAAGRPDVATPPAVAAPPAPPRRRRLVPAALVGVVVAAGAVVAGVLVSQSPRSTALHVTAPTTAPAGGPYPIGAVQVVVAPGDHQVPDPADVGHVLTGTAPPWSTFQYHSDHFGNLYKGIGLAVHLSASHPLHTMTVTFPEANAGFSASAYTASGNPGLSTDTPASAGWSGPTKSLTATGSSASFDLGGATGDWVLLWLTSSVGPQNSVSISHITVS